MAMLFKNGSKMFGLMLNDSGDSDNISSSSLIAVSINKKDLIDKLKVCIEHEISKNEKLSVHFYSEDRIILLDTETNVSLTYEICSTEFLGREQKVSEIISVLMNNMAVNELNVGVELTKDHRYLVDKTFKMFLHFAGQLSRDYDNGYYDGRNENSCKNAKIMIESLEKAETYHRKWFENIYDEVLKKSFD